MDARRTMAVGLVSLLVGCSPEPPAKTQIAPPATVASVEPTPVASASPAPAPAEAAVDLAIAFNPGFSDDIGWAALPERLPLYMLGSPKAARIHAASHYAGGKLEAYELTRFEQELASAELEETSLVLQESSLCSPTLLKAVEKQRPQRLLVSVHWGLTQAGANCLKALPTERIYFAGCLHRPHRAEDACDGDAELATILADDALHERIRGLALSLSRHASVMSLAKVPQLEYLAIVSGRNEEPGSGFSSLPFHALENLRYLDVSEWDSDVFLWMPPLVQFFAGLHTLKWSGNLAKPLPGCQLRRVFDHHLGDEDAAALSACSHLEELSTDSASLTTVEPLSKLSKLKWLHLRHLAVRDLTPLAALESLRVLDLPASRAKDYDFIAEMRALEQIDLSQTALTRLEIFAKLTSLRKLDVGFCKVSDLKPLESLQALEELDVGQSDVRDISSVAKLTALKELSVGKTAVSDLRPLAKHPALEWVILYETKVTDVSPLFTLSKLRRANIMGLNLPSAQVERLNESLGLLNVDD